MLLVLMTLLLQGRPAGAFDIIYPADGTFVTKSNYFIVMVGTDPPIDGLTVEINGIESDVFDIAAPGYQDLFGDKFIGEPFFDPGVNEIVVKGFSRGMIVNNAQANVYFAHKPWDIPPEGYSPFVMHVPKTEAFCGTCHNVQPTVDEFETTDTKVNACATCHVRLTNFDYVHGPAGVFECSSCHDYSDNSPKYQVVNADALCLDCHADMAETIAEKTHVHGPVEIGQCLICHDPHASNEVAQIVTPINELCTACHEGQSTGKHITTAFSSKIHPVSGVKDLSNPSRELVCSSCHNPHASNSEKLFVNDYPNSFALCQHCHDK
jgi:predicted CXXCH cytochrome family protein